MILLPDRLRTDRIAFNRRHLLRCFGAGAIGAMALVLERPALAQPFFREYPFQLGVASGEAAPDGFVIWTRLAPEPFAIGHGMPAAAVEVQWEVAEDADMKTIVQQGTAVAPPELGHAVHVEVAGLVPARPYWYRFTAGRERSGVGRAKTAPAFGAPTEHIRFAIAGCQHYESGYFTAHRHLAEQQPDFVFCYGDYIYEGRGNRIRNFAEGPVEMVRQHVGDEIYSIEDYRRRYAQYKMDADLQAAHAAAPWFVTWDDHEIDNNWVNAIDQDGTSPALFLLRRQMAMQAYYEHMPLRASSMPRGPVMQLYRQARFGDLMDLNLLDTRQYRTDQPCGDQWGVDCSGIGREGTEVLGRQQEAWLGERLLQSDAGWKVLAQQVMMMDLDRQPGAGSTENLDSWAGYRIPRNRVLDMIAERGIDSAIVLTGDEHQNYAGELHRDGTDPGPVPVATEFVSTSISSGGDGIAQRPDTMAIAAENEQLKWHNAQRGYVLCDVAQERWQTEFVVLDTVIERGGEARVAQRLAVERGRPGVVRA